MVATETKFLPYTYNVEDRTMIDFKYAKECNERYIVEKPILTKELEEWGGESLVSIEEVMADYNYRKGLKATRRVNDPS